MTSYCGLFQDCLLHTLPLHHTHGLVNCLLTPLSLGASVRMLSSFNAERVFEELLHSPRVNVFMAVPTIYAKLLQAANELFPSEEQRLEVRAILRQKIRLMVSGSAALPQVCQMVLTKVSHLLMLVGLVFVCSWNMVLCRIWKRCFFGSDKEMFLGGSQIQTETHGFFPQL